MAHPRNPWTAGGVSEAGAGAATGMGHSGFEGRPMIDFILDFAGSNPTWFCLGIALAIGALSVVLMGLCDATDAPRTHR